MDLALLQALAGGMGGFIQALVGITNLKPLIPTRSNSVEELLVPLWFPSLSGKCRTHFQCRLADVAIGWICRRDFLESLYKIKFAQFLKHESETKFNTNKLVLVPAALLVALLSFLGGTQYEKQVKIYSNWQCFNNEPFRTFQQERSN